MKTIRQGTFETNSSSCHTITITCTPQELEEFNEGKRWYYYNWTNGGRVEKFATLEELYPEVAKIIMSPEFEEFTTKDLSYYEDGSEYGLNIKELPWEHNYNDEEYIEKDFQKFKKYVVDNFSFDMFRFAMEDDYEDPRFFSKVILRSFFQKFFMNTGCPLFKITDLGDTYSSSCSPDIRWIPNEYSNATHKILITDYAKDKEKIEVNIDIRDN